MYKLIAFDLDGTLAESKQPLPGAVAFWLRRLASHTKIAIISGCSWQQMEQQCLKQLKVSIFQKSNFLFLPTSGSSLYDWSQDEWIYQDKLTMREKFNIYRVWQKMMDIVELHPPEKTYGEVAEDRGSQVTFSMCGQEAPLEVKEAWMRENEEKRKKLAHYMSLMNLEKQGFKVTCGGTTSIDVTRLGRDKAYGMQQLMNWLPMKKEDILFFGDRLEEGGNDRPVLDMGIQCVEVTDYLDTIEKLKELVDEQEHYHGLGRVRPSSQGSSRDDLDGVEVR